MKCNMDGRQCLKGVGVTRNGAAKPQILRSQWEKDEKMLLFPMEENIFDTQVTWNIKVFVEGWSSCSPPTEN